MKNLFSTLLLTAVTSIVLAQEQKSNLQIHSNVGIAEFSTDIIGLNLGAGIQFQPVKRFAFKLGVFNAQYMHQENNGGLGGSQLEIEERLVNGQLVNMEQYNMFTGYLKAMYTPINTEKHWLGIGLGYAYYSYFSSSTTNSADWENTVVENYYSAQGKAIMSGQYQYHLTDRFMVGAEVTYVATFDGIPQTTFLMAFDI